MASKKATLWTGFITVLVLIGGCLFFYFKPLPQLVPVTAKTPEGPFSFDTYAELLKQVDDSGMVNYKTLKAHPETLNSFYAAVAAVTPAEYGAWSKKRKIAFWINAYNALTLKTIIDNLPEDGEGIRDIRDPWNAYLYHVAGRKVSLNDIEHNILRGEGEEAGFNEPRIHVALVCAAMGCPPLRNEPFTAERLDEQFDDQTRKMMTDPKKFRVDWDRREVYLSKIFKWYGKDFIPKYGTDARFNHLGETERAVLNYLAGYLDKTNNDFIKATKVSVEYLDYDWKLNKQTGSTSPARPKIVPTTPTTPTTLTTLKMPEGPFSFDAYAAVLKQVDDNGMVNYKALKAAPEQLDTFAAALAAVKPDQYDGWSDKRKIAFWINAYNALTLKAIVDHYPVASIRDIKPDAWDGLKFKVAGETLTLNEMEHKKLRSTFNEPRIHVALVCAAMSCPPLRNEPFTAEKLEEQLDDQTRRMLAHPKKFAIDRESKEVGLLKIFKWYGADFVKTYETDDKFSGHKDTERALLNYISRYLDTSDQAFLSGNSVRIKYLPYDWSLNEQRR